MPVFAFEMLSKLVQLPLKGVSPRLMIFDDDSVNSVDSVNFQNKKLMIVILIIMIVVSMMMNMTMLFMMVMLLVFVFVQYGVLF